MVSQLEHAFVSSSTFTLQKLWFYVHPTLHTLSILHTLTTELNEVENPPKDEEDDSSSEEEEDDDDDQPLEAILNQAQSSSKGKGNVDDAPPHSESNVSAPKSSGKRRKSVGSTEDGGTDSDLEVPANRKGWKGGHLTLSRLDNFLTHTSLLTI